MATPGSNNLNLDISDNIPIIDISNNNNDDETDSGVINNTANNLVNNVVNVATNNNMANNVANNVDDDELDPKLATKYLNKFFDVNQDDDDTSEDEKKSLIDWYNQTEYIIFSNELKALRKNNNFVLKECKDNKRLLDLKYDDLNNMVNNIQTSVIFFSTLSGFLQATRIQFAMPDSIISIVSITISTYISLLLSISKYYKLDELKESIQNLRAKYSLLHNKIEYRADILGPWSAKNLWEHQDPKKKLAEWAEVRNYMETDYKEIIETKQSLVTDFEIIMDTKSRNKYHIKNRELNYNNRSLIYQWDQKEAALEERIGKNQPIKKRPSIKLQHEELDNWDENTV